MFSKFASLYKYRYEKEANDGQNSPLGGFSLKGLSNYCGNKAVIDLLMADVKKSKSHYAKLYLTKKKKGFTVCADAIEWTIKEEHGTELKFNFIGIQITKGSRQRKQCYEETNSLIRVQIFDGELVVHESISNIIRDTKHSRKQKMEVASVSFEPKTHGCNYEIILLNFVHQLPFYENELELSNSIHSIQAYNPSDKYPCFNVKFDLSMFTNGYEHLTLHNHLFGFSVPVIVSKIKASLKRTYNFSSLSNSIQYGCAPDKSNIGTPLTNLNTDIDAEDKTDIMSGCIPSEDLYIVPLSDLNHDYSIIEAQECFKDFVRPSLEISEIFEDEPDLLDKTILESDPLIAETLGFNPEDVCSHVISEKRHSPSQTDYKEGFLEIDAEFDSHYRSVEMDYERNGHFSGMYIKK